MQEYIFMLVLIAGAFLLGATPLFRGSRKRKRYLAQGMGMMAKPRGALLIGTALGLFILGGVGLAILLALEAGAWEEAGDMMLLCMALAIGTALVLWLLMYLLHASHVLYDDERILVGRAFHPYEQIPWTSLVRMEVIDQDFFNLYDREGKLRVSASAQYVNYEDFRRIAQRHCRPERELSSGKETAYQQKYAVRSGQGILRYRTGEYFVLLAASLLMPAMVALVAYKSGEDLSVLAGGGLAAMIPVAFPVASLLLLAYVKLQQIDYDTQGMEIRRFPHRTVRLQWREVRRVEVDTYSRGTDGSLTISLYTDQKCYTIRQRQFRKGFPEFEEFLRKIIVHYGISGKR